MEQPVGWDDLPGPLKQAIEARTGPMTGVRIGRTRHWPRTRSLTRAQAPGQPKWHKPPNHGLPTARQAARRSTITQIYEGTNQIQRLVMARQLFKD